jgi:hypothetical protein
MDNLAVRVGNLHRKHGLDDMKRNRIHWTALIFAVIWGGTKRAGSPVFTYSEGLDIHRVYVAPFDWSVHVSHSLFMIMGIMSHAL